MNSSGRHILGLDVIRFCAAVMVTIFHLAFWSWAPLDSLTKSVSGGLVQFPSLNNISWFGWVGVEIFFVLSGFVISYSADGATPASFLRSRIVRLYPAAWISATMTLLAVILLGRADSGTGLDYARSMVLWIEGPWIDGVYWTLSIEITFYALIFTVLYLSHSGPTAGLLGTLGIWSTLFWIGLAFDRVRPGVLPVGFLHDLLASSVSCILLLRHGCFFALGGLLWLSLCKQLTPWRALLIGFCLLGGLLEIIDSARVSIGLVGGGYGGRAVAVAVWLLAVAAIVASVIYNQTFQARVRGLARTIKLLGLMTYPLYLLHDVIGAGLLRTAALLGAPPFAALAIAVTVVVLLSWIVTQFLEPPIQAWLRRRMSSARRPAVQVG